MRCYIFDIDGTLANGDHRIHHIVRSDGQPKDWDSYFDACDGDEPISAIVGLAHDLMRVGATLVFVSGRSDQIRAKTQAWLARHHLPTAHLYMRKAGDHRNDDVLKIEMLKQVREDGFDPIMAFDDRNRVVEAWRAAGVPCAQVAPGDF